jgi:2-polyprenyl-3-methyl-5-hydroxy-6-metoxy-1,4-benzoquinol methylase
MKKGQGKKDYEVERLGAFIREKVLQRVSQEALTVIDVGCGKGYLSLELA